MSAPVVMFSKNDIHVRCATRSILQRHECIEFQRYPDQSEERMRWS